MQLIRSIKNHKHVAISAFNFLLYLLFLKNYFQLFRIQADEIRWSLMVIGVIDQGILDDSKGQKQEHRLKLLVGEEDEADGHFSIEKGQVHNVV